MCLTVLQARVQNQEVHILSLRLSRNLIYFFPGEKEGLESSRGLEVPPDNPQCERAQRCGLRGYSWLCCIQKLLLAGLWDLMGFKDSNTWLRSPEIVLGSPGPRPAYKPFSLNPKLSPDPRGFQSLPLPVSRCCRSHSCSASILAVIVSLLLLEEPHHWVEVHLDNCTLKSLTLSHLQTPFFH